MKAFLQDSEEDFIAEGAVCEMFGMELESPDVSFFVTDDFRTMIG